MLDALEVREGQKVLEIGAGSGYVAALLSELTGHDGCVTTLDIDPILVGKARKNLRQVGKSAVRVLEADAFVCPSGLADEEFDRVLFSASVQFPPQWIVHSLSDGGVMVFPLDLLVTRPGWPCFLAGLKKEGESLRGHFPTQTVQGWLPLEQGGTSLAANPRPEWDTNETYYLFESFQEGLTGMGSPTGLLIYLVGAIQAALESGQIQSLEDCRLWLQSSGWREIHQRWLDEGSPTNASFALSLSCSSPEFPTDRELVWMRESHGQTMCLLGTKT
jgi:SAM-dependent methyltransferase